MAVAIVVVIVALVIIIVHYGGKFAPPTTAVDTTTTAPRGPFAAVCEDGSTWWGRHRNGACSRHLGVRQWLELHAG